MSRLKSFWEQAVKDLGFKIITPFCLDLPSGNRVEAELLVLQFGAEKGMLIVTSYNQVSHLVDEIINEGYGFSVLDNKREDEKYSRKNYIELLEDWGWSGTDSEKPAWLE